MSGHTPEPWDGREVHRRDAQGTPFVLLSMTDYERARACVNYCEGVPNERLTGRKLESALASLDSCMEGYDYVAHQRDELAAALSELVELVPLMEATCMGDQRAIAHCLERARVALAKVKP